MLGIFCRFFRRICFFVFVGELIYVFGLFDGAGFFIGCFFCFFIAVRKVCSVVRGTTFNGSGLLGMFLLIFAYKVNYQNCDKCQRKDNGADHQPQCGGIYTRACIFFGIVVCFVVGIGQIYQNLSILKIVFSVGVLGGGAAF